MYNITNRQTDGRTDGRHDDANNRSYRVAVRSADNSRMAEATTHQGPSSEYQGQGQGPTTLPQRKR